MHGFAFGAMPEEQVGRMKKRVRMLLFPGSTILSKRLPGAPAPPPSPCLPRVRRPPAAQLSCSCQPHAHSVKRLPSALSSAASNCWPVCTLAASATF